MVVLFLAALLLVSTALVVWLVSRLRPPPRGRGRQLPRARPAIAGPERAIRIGDSTRTYHYYMPPGERALPPRPLVVAFHGGLGSGPIFARQTGLSETARRHGFAVAYLNASGRWSDGRATTGTGQGDIDFVEALLDHLLLSELLDEQRIYAVGASNGGMFVLRLACQLPRRFAAFAAVLASMPVGMIQQAPPGPPAPMMLINATHDRVLPWHGGRVASGQGLGAGGEVIGVEATLAFWRRRNRCGAPRAANLKDVAWNTGQVVDIYDYPAGPDGAELRFVKITGGRHMWPRPRPTEYTPFGGLFGAPTGGLEATDLIWEFFTRQAIVGGSGRVLLPQVPSEMPDAHT